MIHDIPLRDRMQGRWAAVLPLLGLERRYLTRKNGPCPFCPDGGRDRWRFIDRDGSGNWICNQCGKGDGVMLAERLVGGGFKEAADRIEKAMGKVVDKPKAKPIDKRLFWMRLLWRHAVPIRHDEPAGRYLARRGIRLADEGLSDALRYCECKDRSLGFMPLLLARVMAPDGKRAVNIQRLFLTADGEKADVLIPRRMMPGDTPLGSHVRLGEPGTRLGVAEGVESALSAAALHGIVVWATLGTANMEAFVVPEGVEELVVFGDHDENCAGQLSAYRLANRAAMRQKLKVSVEIPDTVGDWNDVARRQ